MGERGIAIPALKGKEREVEGKWRDREAQESLLFLK